MEDDTPNSLNAKMLFQYAYSIYLMYNHVSSCKQ